MRDTAKWIVGGIVATAASVFAGSSLTSIGSLDPATDGTRLLIAAGGILVGFIGLGVIVRPAMSVLTVRVTSFEELAAAAKADPAGPAAALQTKYLDALGGPMTALIAAAQSPGASDAIKNSAFFTALPNEANFNEIHANFTALQRVLLAGVATTAAGFGIFAWAANPGPPPTKPAAPVVILVPATS